MNYLNSISYALNFWMNDNNHFTLLQEEADLQVNT